ncbi:Transcriptional regulator [Thoreauomyces humboldtii]|nr:Transcriptional regulator [Thoreauomyces humboldtii]
MSGASGAPPSSHKFSKPPNLDCSLNPGLELTDSPTLSRYVEALAQAAPPKPAAGTPGDPPVPDAFQALRASQLPQLPSSAELLRLQHELLELSTAMARREETMAKNIKILRDWLPSAEALERELGGPPPKSGVKVEKPRKVDVGGGTVIKDRKKQRLSSVDDNGAERTGPRVPKIKLKISQANGIKIEAIGSFALSDNLTRAELVELKRRREKEQDDASDVEKKMERSGSITGISKPTVVRLSQTGVAPPSLASSSSTVKPAVPPQRSIAPNKKSGAHKNSRLKKRHSVIDDDDATVSAARTPEPAEKTGQKTVEGDFTKAKTVQNQVPIQNFWTFVDQFFRPLTEDDLRYLDTEGDEVTPYVMPALGRPYKDQWADEDARQYAAIESGAAMGHYDIPDYHDGTTDGTPHQGILPLSERIIASLMENRVHGGFTPGSPVEVDDAEDHVIYKTDRDCIDLEHRMRNELRHIGLIDEDEVDANPDEQDDISVELRSLQAQLRQQVAANRSRKRKLKEVATKWMGWQEYNGVVDDINKNIEQAYNKRFRTPAKSKGKKKITRGEYRPIGENVMQHLNNRNRIISELGAFLPAEDFALPVTSIYAEPG